MSRQSFPPEKTAVRSARRFVTEALAAEDAEVSANAVLMVSELAANSVRHAKSQFTVNVDITAEDVRVEVTDQGAGTPNKRNPTPDDMTGRGLLIIDHLADGWGTTIRAGRTTVWFVLHRQSSHLIAR